LEDEKLVVGMAAGSEKGRIEAKSGVGEEDCERAWGGHRNRLPKLAMDAKRRIGG
jgi:hypothetical protein